MNCRLCDHNTDEILDLGSIPLANDFKSSFSIKYPLNIHYCSKCGLIQLSEIVDYKILFGDYAYHTASSLPLVNHLKDTSKFILDNLSNNCNDLIVEFGCNDGSFLENFINKRKIVGVDPAENFDSILSKKRISHVVNSFNMKICKKIKNSYGPAKVIFASNVLAHISDLKETIESVKFLLRNDGYFVFEVHHAADLISNCCFDQIYHEHVYYFTLRSIQELLKKYSLNICCADKINIHGSSLRIVCSQEHCFFPSDYSLILKEEKEKGLFKNETYSDWSIQIEKKKKIIRQTLIDLKLKGHKIVGYGAPAKSTTMCNFLDLNKNLIDYTVDNTINKQNQIIPGTDIPIYKPDRLYEDKFVDYIFLFSWNYTEYILNKESELRKTKKFIIPFPEFCIV